MLSHMFFIYCYLKHLYTPLCILMKEHLKIVPKCEMKGNSYMVFRPFLPVKIEKVLCVFVQVKLPSFRSHPISNQSPPLGAIYSIYKASCSLKL